jgi:hypothetical protein
MADHRLPVPWLVVTGTNLMLLNLVRLPYLTLRVINNVVKSKLATKYWAKFTHIHTPQKR